jgi:hypothetical protein
VLGGLIAALLYRFLFSSDLDPAPVPLAEPAAAPRME